MNTDQPNQPTSLWIKLFQNALAPIVLLILAIMSYVYAAEETDLTSAPYLEFADPEIAALFPLLSMDVKAEIVDGIVQAKVTQVYANRSDEPIEASYIFPLSTHASVHGMKIRIGDREIIADIEEKKKAKKIYEKAKEEQKVASLLEQHRPNVFETKVANILPGNQVEVVIEFSELLHPEDLVYEWVFPTVVGPRYDSGATVEGGGSLAWTQSPYFETDAVDSMEQYTTFSLDAVVKSSVDFQAFRNVSHQPQIDYTNKREVRLKLDSSQPGFQADRDFIVQYKLAENKIISGLMAHQGEEENYFLINVQPPVRVKPEHIPGREYIFVVDVSGSMNGFPLDVTKKLFRNLASDLRESDRFNILFFAGGSTLLSEASLPATKGNISRAIKMMSNQHGGGGTELEKALRQALKLEIDHDYARSFVVITDGYIRAEKGCFELIRESRNDANVFCFGIGRSVNRHLIEGIAKVGGGEPFVLTSQGNASKTAKKFKDYISAPVLTNIQVEARGITLNDVQPASINDLFANRTLMISGKWAGDTPGQLIVSGKTGGGETYTQAFPLDPSSRHHAPVLEKLWARHTVRELIDFHQVATDSDLQKQITRLGLKHNIVTPFTSFVAVDHVPQSMEGQAKSVRQPLPLPSGVSPNAISSGQSFGGGGSIPEPSAIYLLLISVVSVLMVRRRK